MDETKLKPCPFCGKPVEYRDFAPGYSTGEFYISHEIKCKNCGIARVEQSRFAMKFGMPVYIKNGFETLVNIWNRRADHD